MSSSWRRPAGCMRTKRFRPRCSGPCNDREADGNALERRQAHGIGVRCGGSATFRRQAKPAQSTLQLLKRAVDKGRFGRIYLATINVFWSRPQSYYDSAAWRGTWEFDGGAFMNQASHLCRSARLAGRTHRECAGLHGDAGTRHRGRGHRCNGSALAFRCARVGQRDDAGVSPKNIEGSITILGESGTVRIGGVAVNEIKHWEFASADDDDARIADASYETTSVYGFGHPLYYDNVLRVLRGEDEPETDGREGLKSLEVLIACYLAARDGRRVSLPLEY